MTHFEVIMPKMGESIEEATITKWFVKPGDFIKEDDILLEIATDKVDSEIPSPVEGTIEKLLFNQDEIVPVGTVIAVIKLKQNDDKPAGEIIPGDLKSEYKTEKTDIPGKSGSAVTSESRDSIEISGNIKASGRFYSPLVRRIAREENISQQELDSITGSGQNGRVKKNDLLTYIEKKRSLSSTSIPLIKTEIILDESLKKDSVTPLKQSTTEATAVVDEIIEMDRIRKIIADHMVKSKQISAHVTNFIEVDVTDIVNWRNRIKDVFEKKEGVKITFLPIFLESVIRGLKDFPLINSSVEGDRIRIKKRINLGIAVALPNYNLIVPVIKNADHLNLSGLTKELNRLANSARNNQLKPDEIQDGTFTITNFGSFKNTIGTPIINQPQVAILAIGTIEKKPSVLELPQGDVIAIRHKMFLSLTYDHRIIDGSLGGSFLRKIGDYLESFDVSRTI